MNGESKHKLVRRESKIYTYMPFLITYCSLSRFGRRRRGAIFRNCCLRQRDHFFSRVRLIIGDCLAVIREGIRGYTEDTLREIHYAM